MCSGGNDNKLFVWSGAATTPMQTLVDFILDSTIDSRLVSPKQTSANVSRSSKKTLVDHLKVDHRCKIRIFHSLHYSSSPLLRYTEHLAAVKAIAWSPHHHGLLASGGGTADRYIRF